MRLENSAYTILESVTDSIFLHVTTNPRPQSAWGNLFKSNSNGTNFAFSLEYANRNERGYVDFEKMIGLEGIALMNIVSNPTEAAVTGAKKLQSRITYNDGKCTNFGWICLSPMLQADAGGLCRPQQKTRSGTHIPALPRLAVFTCTAIQRESTLAQHTAHRPLSV